MSKLTYTRLNELRLKIHEYEVSKLHGSPSDSELAEEQYQAEVVPYLPELLSALMGELGYSRSRSELPTGEPEFVVLAKVYEKTPTNKHTGAPYWGPRQVGYTDRISQAGLYTHAQAEAICRDTHGDHISYAVDDPRLRTYLFERNLTRGAEYDLWHQNRQLLQDLAEANEYNAEVRATAELRQKAWSRGLLRWRQGHPERELMWPDMADHTVYLLDKVEELSTLLGIPLPVPPPFDEEEHGL